MALLRLENIGKIYTQESAVAVGIRGINVSFDVGEFVAITGESGCGKTTLLNVISGQDTYEEGELYIQEKPTSHYIQKNWEEYRREYIAFIFQDYNIIESFTVLQNVELALTRIADRKQRRKRALELIDRVGMTPFLKHKGSHLSGGQKQRTVIARALAKDSPIILADEPTGNLDSQSAKEIVALLAEIAKDKLLIMVTHDYEDVEDYATRHICIHDGAIKSDEIVQKRSERFVTVKSPERWGGFRKFKEGFFLGLQRFAAKPKFAILMTCVMLFCCVGLLMVTALTTQMGLPQTYGVEPKIFRTVDGRRVVCRRDGASMTETDLEYLRSVEGVQIVLFPDEIMDRPISFLQDLSCYPYVTEQFERPDWGEAPTRVGEVMLYLPIYQKINRTLEDFQSYIESTIPMNGLKCTGVKFFYDNRKDSRLIMNKETYLQAYSALSLSGVGKYLSGSGGLSEISELKIDPQLKGKEIKLVAAPFGKFGNIRPGDIVALATEEIGIVNGLTTKEVEYSDTLEFQEIIVFVSEELIPTYFSNFDNRRTSLFFRTDQTAEAAFTELADHGYVSISSDVTFKRDSGYTYMIMNVLSKVLWVMFIVLIGLVAALVLGRAVLSTQEDIAIFRSMGIDDASVKVSQYIQLLVAFVPAYIGMLAVALCLFMTAASKVIPFLGVGAYCFIFIGGLAISGFVAHRLNRRMYRKTVRKNLGRDSK